MFESDKLSKKDIELLTKEGSSEDKSKVIEKISSQYGKGGFSDSETSLAEEVFRLLLKYSEIGVRKSIAENLMNVDYIPRDILLSLAKDIEDVSQPILEFSDLLTDDDLLDIISSTENPSAQVSIASRASLSEQVSGALVDTKRDEVVENLLNNSGAKYLRLAF